MAKTKRRQAFAEQYVFSAEEFEASGIRELSFEELLKVNGGKVVKDDPWTDKNSETCPYSSNAPRTDSSSGSSGGGSSSSNYGSSSGTNNDSSGYSEPVTGNHSDDSGGYTDYPEAGYIDYPGNGYTAGYESGGSSGGGSGSTGGSSGNSDSSDDSSSYNSSDSSDNDYSSGDDSDSGYWGGGYTPPAQSQPAPKPNKGEETSPTQGGGAPYGEAVVPVKNQGKNAGAANSGTKSRGASSVREFWGNVLKDTTGKIWDKFGNVNKTNAESYVERSRGGSWQSKENFPVPTVRGSKPSSGGYVPPVEQVQGPIEKNLWQKFAETQTSLIGTKYVYGAENPLNPQEGGVDCSGAVQYGLRTMGFMLPNRVNADTFLKKYTTEIERTEIQTGDLRGLQTQGGKFYHVQTLMDTYRVNPCGDETNTKDNPGIVESLSSSLPASGVIRRLDENALNPYYDSSKDIVGGKLSVGQLDRAFSALLKYSN